MKPKFVVSRRLSLASVLALTISAASATSYWWDTSGTALWATGADWSNAATAGTTGTVPLSTDTVTFNQTGDNAATVVQLNAATTIAGITFANTGTTLIDSSSSTSEALTVGASGITVNSGAGAVTIGDTTNLAPITLGGAQTWTNSSSNALTIVNAVTGGANLLTIAASTAAINLQGGLTGTGGVTFTGTPARSTSAARYPATASSAPAPSPRTPPAAISTSTSTRPAARPRWAPSR